MFQEQYHGGHQFWACTIIGLAFSFVSANMKDSYFIKTYSGTNTTLKKVPFWLWRTNLEMFSETLGDCKVNLALQKDYKKHKIECPSWDQKFAYQQDPYEDHYWRSSSSKKHLTSSLSSPHGVYLSKQHIYQRWK